MRAGKNADTRTTESITLSSKSEGQGALRRVLEGRKHTRGAGGRRGMLNLQESLWLRDQTLWG